MNNSGVDWSLDIPIGNGTVKLDSGDFFILSILLVFLILAVIF